MQDEVIGFEALYTSMYKCKKGVLWKASTAGFFLNGMENIIKLEHDLKAGTYKPRLPYSFIITSPKPRNIMSICFRDRVYQRSLNDVAVYPQMTKSFIYDNFACQKNKGTDKARERLKFFLHRMYRHNGTAFYILQCDVHGYYPNMRHEVAKSKFQKGLDKISFDQCAKILDGQYQGSIGYNPGSQMVQIAGISVLDDLDHYIKERLHIKNYIRYMDDFILMHQDLAYLEKCKTTIEKRLAALGFEFNAKKTKIYPVNQGIMFLGFKFMLSGTGKLIMLVDPGSVKRERKKLKKMARLYRRGKMQKYKIYECYRCWKNHAGKGNSFNLIIRMDNFVKSLMKEV